MAEKKSTRIAYGEALAKLGAVDEKILVCDADLAHATMTANFADKYPDRFYNFGIAESNMMTASAAMAQCGYTVFCSTFAVFGAGRAFEQVRNAVCYSKANVKIGCSHAGPSCGEDGGSHQAVEDISLMRTLPNMTVLVPADATEMEKAVAAAAKYEGPVYIRTGRLPTDICTEADTPFEIGKANVLRDGGDVAIIACGIMAPQAVLAAEALAEKGVRARVIDMHTIKPLDEALVLKAARETGAIVTSEEASVLGGLGGAVAELLAENCPVPVVRHGVNDSFGRSGTASAVLEHYGLTPEVLAQKCRKAVAMKK